MDNRYNRYNFKYVFKQYLQHCNYGSVTVKNYISDLTRFCLWADDGALDQSNLKSYFTLANFDRYKNTLLEEGIKRKTINRQLSTLRKFCIFATQQNWLTTDPAQKLNNLESTTPKIDSKNISDNVIQHFNNNLVQEKANPITIKNYTADLKEFFNIIQKSESTENA